jgi:hypothetical protein
VGTHSQRHGRLDSIARRHLAFVYFANYADGTPDQAAHLKFIETRWELPPLGSRDMSANNMMNAFDL